ncbi:MAG TPA: hypothetical protein DCP28_02840, partial [Cytophagales bacterium]|nr:hypothetical protein [Cytophagales bacterium]
MKDDAAVNTSNFTEKFIAVAFRTGNDITNWQTVYEQGGGTNGFSIMIENDSVFVGAWSESTGWTYQYLAGKINTGQNCVVVLEFSSLDGELRGWLNGASLGTVSSIPDVMNAHSGDVGIGGTLEGTNFNGRTNNGNYFTGKVMEVLSLNGVMSNTERQILENYLGARFLAPLGSQDYFGHESTHSYGVSGIGRGSANDFKNSTNIGDLVSIGNASSLDIDDFMIIGHDNGLVDDYVSTESPSVDLERLSREWRVGINGDPGTITLTFDPTELPASAFPSFGFDELVLLVDTDGDFTTGTAAYPMTQNGDVYEATEVPLGEGDYFTIGAFRPRVAFAEAASNSPESAGSVDITVQLNFPIGNDFTVTATQTGGTATEGDDYTF